MSSQAPPAPAAVQGNADARLSEYAPADVQHIGDLSNKIALVTGASSGLGRAISQAFAAAGAFIVNADLTPNPPKAPILEKVMEGTGRNFDTPTVELVNKEFPSADGRPRMAYVQCDVTKAASVEAAVAFAVRTYGRLDIMVNNAGITAQGGGSPASTGLRTHELPERLYEAGMDVNVRGVWLGIKYAVGQMLKQEPHPSGDRGWIINMCSIMGIVALANAAVYCATKGAVLQLTKACALEYANDRIHINCINPGFAETSLLEPMRAGMGQEVFHGMLSKLHPWGRLAVPEDIAKMAVFLAGPGASFITGAPFIVDGGYVAQ